MRLKQISRRVKVRLRKSLQTRGLFATVKWGLHHLHQLIRNVDGANRAADHLGLEFDAAHQVDTAGKIELVQLDISSPNLVYGGGYQASAPAECREALRSLAAHERFTFIDFGCGKGRSLMIASEFPFRRIIGLEFSPELCTVARKNLQTLREKSSSYREWEILCLDAATYNLPHEPSVLYFYNPFDWEVMRVVIDNVLVSLRRAPRSLYAVYVNPKHSDLWEGDKAFRTVHCTPQYKIYEAVAMPVISAKDDN